MLGKLGSLLRPASRPDPHRGGCGGLDDWSGGPQPEDRSHGRLPLPRPFTFMDGHAYRTCPGKAFTSRSDNSVTPRVSRLVLYEDGVRLGPRHSAFAVIAGDGAGCYSHFLDQLDFSASDNSDPNTNGRDYSFAVEEPSPVTLGLGGCHMNALVRSIYRRGWIDFRGLDMGVAYSPLEQLRLVQRQFGLQHEPEEIAPLCVSTPPTAQNFLRFGEPIDLLLIETTAHTNAVLGDACLNRAQIMQELLGPAKDLGRELYEQVSRWYGQGLMKCDDEARESAAEAILANIDGTVLDKPYNRLALREARGVRETPADIEAHLAEVRDLLKPQRAVVLRGPNLFLPDGRGVSWGANLLDDLRQATSRLGMPLIDIGELVLEKGFAFSVLPDMHHHTDGFIDYLGEVVMDKVQSAWGPWPWPQGVPKPLPARFAR
ncbi:hypothetical protein BH09PSE2_BH09PSE2_02210 [soil metagenome]